MIAARKTPGTKAATHQRITAFAPHSLAVLGGVLVAIGLPPLAWWPAMLLGVACYVVAAERASRRATTQFVLAALFAWAWLAPAMGWMWHLVPGGFVIAPLLFSAAHGVVGAATARIAPSTGTTDLTSRIVLRMALHALVEAARVVVPFGGVPLAGLALGVADTRLAHLVRLVGPLGLGFWLLLSAGVLAELWLQRHDATRRSRRNAAVMLLSLLALQAIALVAPSGIDTGHTMRIAAVQGGGEQGVLAINTNPRDVTDRHLAATSMLAANEDLDLVVWPENTIDVRDFSTSKALDEIVAEVERLSAPFAVGVTEDAGRNFTNAQIVVDEAGQESSRYDKVRRVPYGEYIPLRGFLRAIGAPVDRIPRDAVSGTSRAIIEVPLGGDDRPPTVTMAVAISWEVFFASRVNDGVSAGGQVVLNPTNGSSYTGEILQQQQVASSQLRALESGRYLVQAATTGFSLVVDPNGQVLQRVAIGERDTIVQDVALRTGRTVYSYLGDTIVSLLIAAVALVAVVVIRRKSSTSDAPLPS